MKRLKRTYGAPLIAAILAIPGLSSRAAIDHVEYVRREGNAVLLRDDRKLVRISVMTPEIVRVQATEREQFTPSLMVDAGFVRGDWPRCEMEVSDASGATEISTAGFTIRVTKSPFALEVRSTAGRELLKTVCQGGVELNGGTALEFEMTPEDHFFGFGYMRKCFDARGNTLTWTRSYRNDEATVPFFMSPRGYAFFSNNTWKNDFDFTGDDSFRITTEAGDLDFFIMVGKDFRMLLNLYTDLTGKPQMAPKWSLGLEHRARYYDDQEDVLETARTFRRHSIPCEIIALEPGWEEKPYAMKWEWSPHRFPDYGGMIRELKEMGYKFDLWESGAAPKKDLLNANVRREWFALRSAALTDWGVDMFKQDDPYPRSIKSAGMEAMVKSEGEVSGTKRHPREIITVANTFYTQTAFQEWRRLTGRRPVIQFHAYNASIASQRWPYQWAGDFGTGWGLYNASLSGHSMANADARSPYADARHLDFFMSAGPVNDCWAYCIEPWSYSDRLLETCRMYASLRARLYPYLYSAMREAHETGMPIMRPMVLMDPSDPETYKIGSQFFVGDSLLVATSVELDQFGDHARKRVVEAIPDFVERATPVYLPKGTWVDYWTGREHEVEQSRWVDCRFPSHVGGPLFVKVGAVIPMAQVKQHTEQWPDELLTLDIYPGIVPRKLRLYEDDGVTFGCQKGRYANTTFSVVRESNTVTIDLGRRAGDYDGKPARRDYLLKVHSALTPAKVLVDGRRLMPQAKGNVLFSSEHSGWYYDATHSKIIVKPNTGWCFARSAQDPAGTYPLAPAEERIELAQATDYSARSSHIEIQLDPDQRARVRAPTQVVFEPENTRVLADGGSSVTIGVKVCDRDGNRVEDVNQTLPLKLKGGGQIPGELVIKAGRGEIRFMAAHEPGTSTLTALETCLTCEPLTLHAVEGSLHLTVNPRMKVGIPGKGGWLAKRFTIAVSARDKDGNRLATQSEVKLTIRDYRDRETIKRTAAMRNGEVEFRDVAYKTRPEKFIISATAESLEPATFRAFDNAWHFPDDYLTNPEIKQGLEELLDD